MFYFDNFFGKKVLKSSLLQACNHFFTTRDFILHSGSRDDFYSESQENVNFLIDKLKIKEESLYRCKQTHSNNVKIADCINNLYENTDGIILTKPNTATFLNFADCIPIILYDEKNNIGSVIHAGWRGTASLIQQKAVQKLVDLGSNHKDIKVAMGAGIGKCCFNVNEDVFQKLLQYIDIKEAEKYNIFTYEKETDKYFVDLKLVNKLLLEKVYVHQVDISDYCTSCSNDVFFSYRKENGHTARHSAVLKIEE